LSDGAFCLCGHDGCEGAMIAGRRWNADGGGMDGYGARSPRVNRAPSKPPAATSPDAERSSAGPRLLNVSACISRSLSLIRCL
jgi:hypothetical protein